MARASKGSAFERDFCRRLSIWWSGDEAIDSLFWRTASSGGRAKLRGRKGKQTASHHGDICATNGEGQPFIDMFTCELKRGYNRATIVDLLDKPERAALQTYEKWILQACESAKQAGTPYWMIVHRRDQRDALILMEREAFTLCLPSGSLSLLEIDTLLGFRSKKQNLPLILITLDSFLANATPKCVYEAMK
jgi:hypothetical protein